jgi:nucleoside-diphosphate-sugar epimerase
MSIRWVTPHIGTAPAPEVSECDGAFVLDVRDLVDRSGNSISEVRRKIHEGAQALKNGRTVLVACDYGISRSNAIAAGLVSLTEGITVNDAVRRVRRTTGETEMKVDLISCVRRALAERQALHQRPDPKPRIMVTGAGGFVGTALCATLLGSADVLPLTRQEADLEEGATDLELLADEHETECMVHLASPRIYTSNVAMGRSLTMLRNVIDVCCTREARLVFLSGWEVYSAYRGSLVVDESVPMRPRGPYGETKLLCETLIEHSRATRGLRCMVLRPSPVYGAASDRPRFIRTFVEKALSASPIVTHRYRNGDPGLDLLHLDDLIEAIAKATRTDSCDSINLGTGIVTTTRAIARHIIHRLGSSSSLGAARIDDDTARISMDFRRATDVLGWKPRTALLEGLELVIQDSAANARRPCEQSSGEG